MSVPEDRSTALSDILSRLSTLAPPLREALLRFLHQQCSVTEKERRSVIGVWARRCYRLPPWLVPYYHHMPNTDGLCMALNHLRGAGCLREGCTFTHRCLLCGAEEHGVFMSCPVLAQLREACAQLDTDLEQLTELVRGLDADQLPPLAAESAAVRGQPFAGVDARTLAPSSSWAVSSGERGESDEMKGEEGEVYGKLKEEVPPLVPLAGEEELVEAEVKVEDGAGASEAEGMQQMLQMLAKMMLVGEKPQTQKRKQRKKAVSKSGKQDTRTELLGALLTLVQQQQETLGVVEQVMEVLRRE